MSEEKLWKILLEIKKSVRSVERVENNIVCSNGKVFIDENIPEDAELIVSYHAEDSHFYLDESFSIHRGNLPLSNEEAQFYEIYLCFSLASLLAKREGRTFSVAHFAQSLDGRIATNTGHSQWIGNDENLCHAHRMRALCDGVVVGSQTLMKDKPRLTVRHVEGDDPVRIILGSGTYNMESLKADATRIIQITNNGQIADENVEVIKIASGGEMISSKEVLKLLYQKGIFSIYVEGGNVTTSGFLEDNCLDVIQLHIAPMIVGSGINTFSLPEKKTIDDAVVFHQFKYFRMGDEIMFQGKPKRS